MKIPTRISNFVKTNILVRPPPRPQRRLRASPMCIQEGQIGKVGRTMVCFVHVFALVLVLVRVRNLAISTHYE